MKINKFRIIDEDGQEYQVIEECNKESEIVDEEPVVEEDESYTLTTDELKSLKMLAEKAPELLKLLEVEEAEHKAVSEELEDNDIEENNEVILDTKNMDSKKSFGSLRKIKHGDSIENDDSLEIENAWINRYGGNR